MAGSSGHPSQVTSVEFPAQLPGLVDGVHSEAAISAIDLALQSTEAALGQLATVVVENIRVGGEVSPQVEAAERDLRSALRQLSLAKRHAGRPLSGGDVA